MSVAGPRCQDFIKDESQSMEDRQWVWQHYGTCSCAKNREGQAGTGEKSWKVGVKHSERSMGILLPARVTGSPAHIWGCAAKRLADHSWVQPSMTLESRWCLWWDYAYIYIKWHSYICAFVHVYEYSILHLAGSSREKERSHALRVSKWWSGCWKSCGKTGWPPFTFDEGWWNLQSWAMCQWLLPRLSRNLHALCNSAQCGFKLLLDIVGKWPKAPKLLLKPFLTKSWQELAKSFGMSLIQMGSRMKWHFGVTGLAYNMWPSMQMTQLHQWIPQWPRI